jgi:hypothetical protein
MKPLKRRPKDMMSEIKKLSKIKKEDIAISTKEPV